MKALDKQAHPYIPNGYFEVKEEMIREIGVEDVDELYADVPGKYRLEKPLNLPEGLSEFEVKKHVETLLSRNKSYGSMPTFVGAGCWAHYVPAAVKEIVRRSELLTSYTPYQPEVSQGILQILFEYQSMICELTGMEVSNCSMYDWASALGEAARMAARLTKRNEILTPRIIHPERAAVLRVYTEPAGVKVRQLGYDEETGQISLEDLRMKLSDRTAAVYVENPSYLGFVETQVDELSRQAHGCGALLMVGVDPTSLGILRPPGDYGADIVVGEAQPLGNPMNFGGPLSGILACRDDLKLVRQMPGRIIGLTTSILGDEQGFCMALQTREQHIKRERATSNICSNESLCAVASAVYMSLLGPEGFRELGHTVMCKANYALRLLSKMDGVEAPVFKSAHFKEFTVNFDNAGLSVEDVHEKLLGSGVRGGRDVSGEFPELGNTSLFCVTETLSAEDIECLASVLEEILSRGG